MCTVTFLPEGDNHFILTSNRDEHTLRKKALPPQKYLIDGQTIYFPKDMQAGGTWIATGINNFTLCLMNGAFKKHVWEPPYIKSRGIMLLDFFNFNDVEKFAEEYNFKGIEPFTMLVLDASAKLRLHELRWDGVQTNLIERDATAPHIWSSVSLYEKEVIIHREEWFDEWLKNQTGFTMDSIFKFHQFGGAGDKATDLLMNRNDILMTISITSIQKSDDGIVMKYRDVVADKFYNLRIL